MTKIVFRILLPVAMVAAFSCARRVEGGYASIKLVDDLLVDSLSYLQDLAGCSGKASGSIALIGDPFRCLEISELLMTADDFDNVDGRPVPDGLPDFAGETIMPILEFSNPFYSGEALPKDSLSFREAAVRSALFALEQSCLVSPYDPDSTFDKSSPKALLLCSGDLARFGIADIQDLFNRLDCRLPILSSPDTAYSFSRECYRLFREKNLFTHLVAYPKAKLYMTVPAGSGRPGFALIEFSDRYVLENFRDTMQVLAPKTMESYVQSQYQP
ncbi:MAG: hypothetical protein ACOX5T_08450 [Candidatus Cryptobacteroides sp.]